MHHFVHRRREIGIRNKIDLTIFGLRTTRIAGENFFTSGTKSG